jgi:hypothetical protein
VSSKHTCIDGGLSCTFRSRTADWKFQTTITKWKNNIKKKKNKKHNNNNKKLKIDGKNPSCTLKKRLGLNFFYKEWHSYPYKLVCKDELSLIKKPNMVSRSIYSGHPPNYPCTLSLIVLAVRRCIGKNQVLHWREIRLEKSLNNGTTPPYKSVF